MGEKSPFENLVNAVRADDITDQRHAAEVAETIIEESPEVRTFNAPSTSTVAKWWHKPS